MSSSALVRQQILEKENSEFKPAKLRLKIDLVSYPARAEGLGKYIYIYIYSWKPDRSDKMRRSFFQTAVVSILLYRCTIWTTKQMEKKLDSNYTRMLQAILNKP